MEPVLLGLAATSAASEAGSLLERTLHTVAEPFATILEAMSEALSAEDQQTSPIEGGDLESYLDDLQASLAGQIQQALSPAGVELTEPLQLQISEIDGRLEVVGEHPQKALIEAALADDSDLARNFSELVTLRQLRSATSNIDQESSDNVLLGIAQSDAVTALFSTEDGVAKLSVGSQNRSLRATLAGEPRSPGARD
jgi:hypothetical protein